MSIAHTPRDEEDRVPNIIFLLTDDQAYNTTGFNGHPLANTPNMDKLAEDGFVCDNYYDTSAICMASRSTIMTGLYEYKTACNFEHGALSQNTFLQSYPVLLRNAGYFTGFAGKFGFSVSMDKHDPLQDVTTAGYVLPVDEFDWWRGWPGQGSYTTENNESMKPYAKDYPHLTRALGAASCEFLQEAQDSGKPFCLSVSFKAPHVPLEPDPVFDDVYEDVTFPTPANYGDPGAAHLSRHIRTGRSWDYFEEWLPEHFESRMRKYSQQIYGVDYAIGMIREQLKALGLEDDTIIIFSSDNGYFCGSHHLGDKVMLYEEGARVPMVIYDPRSSSARRQGRSRALCGNIDIAPTILDIAGLPVPDGMDGKSMLPLLDDPEATIHESIALVQFWNAIPTQSLAVTDGKWKYFYYWYQGHGLLPSEELYDLEGDAVEMANLAKDKEYADQLEMMRATYDRFIDHIKQNAVAFNNYGYYGILFDRNIDWKDKSDACQSFLEDSVARRGRCANSNWLEDVDGTTLIGQHFEQQ